MLATLGELYPAESNKLDFNNAAGTAIAQRLRSNEKVASSPLTSDEVDIIIETELRKAE